MIKLFHEPRENKTYDLSVHLNLSAEQCIPVVLCLNVDETDLPLECVILRGVIIKMKATDQYFPAVLFVTLYRLAQAILCEENEGENIQIKPLRPHLP